MNQAASTCPECGKPVTGNGLEGLCPECMLRVGLAAESGELNPDGTPLLPGSSAQPLSVAEVARHFPELEILDYLGCGGMGAVYKARQPALDRVVALKLLKGGSPEERGRGQFAERFQREARALAKLSHPHIVAVFEFGEAGGMPYLVMEYVPGPNLRQLEQAGRLTPERALRIVPQICEALQYAHDAGIVHRDIKPENILVDPNGRVKIADFGIAKMLGRESDGRALTQGQQVVGTPHYMAPEQVERPAAVDHRADIYSLGVVFYEMLTGELPLGKFAAPSRRAALDRRLDEVVLHALEKEPERRYQHASQVRADVETIATNPSAALKGRPQEPAPWLVQLRLPALLAGAACFGTLVGLSARLESDRAVELGVGGAAGCLIAAYRYWKWPPRGASADKGQGGRGPWESVSFWAGAVSILTVALLVWLAAPRFPDYTLSGTVSDAETGKPIGDATVMVLREGVVVRQCQADGQGRFEVGWPRNADVLYRTQEGRQVRVELVFAAAAPRYEPSSAGQSSTREAGYCRRGLDFRLQPKASASLAGAEDVADVQAEEKVANGDGSQRFFLMGPEGGGGPSTNGYGLLLVLPGGDGGPDFLPFVKRIYRKAVPRGYLVAQLVAPRWDAQQAEQIVWPTQGAPYPGMRFTTEAFVHAVIAEIEKQHRLDAGRLFTLSWSSGGPAGYAASLHGGGRITGSLVAMSVFQPRCLPDLKAARGRAYYLLHSPDDELIPLAMARQARDVLAEQGAQATLATYPGGHGWQGDVYGNIRTGIEWLEQHATPVSTSPGAAPAGGAGTQ